MAIPKNIEREHVILAMEQIDREGYPPERAATGYWVWYKGKHYPPKYVLSLANKFANDEELYAFEFNGGKPTNNRLKKLGFEIRLINSEDQPQKEDKIIDDIESELVEEYGVRKEGASKEYYGKRYERDALNRKQAISIHGYSCIICGFNYEEVYGERGKEFIEVHHVKPLSSLDEEEEFDPRTDLVPVCANCHRIIHRRHNDVLSIEQMKSIIETKV